MQVVVRQHPFYFEDQSVHFFYSLWWVKKKKRWSQGLQS